MSVLADGCRLLRLGTEYLRACSAPSRLRTGAGGDRRRPTKTIEDVRKTEQTKLDQHSIFHKSPFQRKFISTHPVI